MEQKSNKKPVIALVLIAVLGVVGTTIAYFTSTNTFENVFGTKSYSMEVNETFNAPNDWTPGTTTPKTITATNKGSVDAAVRVSMSESWVDSNSNSLPLVDSNNRPYSIINFASDVSSKWTMVTENGRQYWYYKTKLTPNASTSSLIQSVTFNPDADINGEPLCVPDASTNTEVCTNGSTGHAGGTYTLNITVETVQFDKYQEAWNTSVEIN